MQVQKFLFDGREGEVFHLQDMSNPSISLTLTKVESPEELILQRARQQGVREPFSVLFCGSLEPFLPQHMYTLQHDELGMIEMFLVPVKQDENGYYYEAVFG